jgi:phenylalanine-4-hydroxylase
METTMPSAVESAPRSSPDAAPLRGDYSNMSADYRVAQDWGRYGAAEHELWRRLYQRQSRLVPAYACAEFNEALSRLDAVAAIPRLDDISRKLRVATGWEIVPVPGLIPDETFFTHLAGRRFPVTVWLRQPEEFDYIVEPDVFHDFFGHVPLLFDGAYADHLQEFGKGGLKAMRLDALGHLARLYWYTIEFGLVDNGQGLKVYGAGILSSGGEMKYSIEDPAPRRLPFELERVMRTEYRIDSYQDTYFVIRSFEQLLHDTAPDFTPIYSRLKSLPSIAAAPAAR